MDRNKLNYVVDALMFVAIVAIGFIGILLGLVIPTGNAPASSKYLWGLHRHEWGNMHFYLALFLLALFILHIYLHWSWIKTTTQKYLRGASLPWLFVVAPFIVILLFGILMLRSTQRENFDEHEFGERQGRRGAGLHSNTITNVSAEHMIQ